MGCNGMASSFFPANFLLQMQTPHEEDSHPPSSHTAILSATSCADLQDYHNGVAAMMGKRSMSFSAGMEVCEDQVNGGEEDFSDDCSQAGEKKRRLNMEQVRTLEKNFELGNKLEPERKMQLARALGLQPRQIAIWFQNRRARWKTKQLEKDYDVLKKQFDTVKSENDSLRAHNKKLQEEIMGLKGMEIPEPINLNKETEVSCSYRSDNSSVVNLDISAAPAATSDSPLNSNQNKNFFQPIRPTPGAAHHQLAHHQHSTTPSSRPELQAAAQCPKIESGGGGGGGAPHAQEENFCNMFCSLEDQHSFWTAWQEQQHNFH